MLVQRYRHDKFAVLLRELLDATYLADSCMLSNVTYSPDDPAFHDLDMALQAQQELIETLVDLYSDIQSEAAEQTA
jgi:hypothetical protein